MAMQAENSRCAHTKLETRSQGHREYLFDIGLKPRMTGFKRAKRLYLGELVDAR